MVTDPETPIERSNRRPVAKFGLASVAVLAAAAAGQAHAVVRCRGRGAEHGAEPAVAGSTRLAAARARRASDRGADVRGRAAAVRVTGTRVSSPARAKRRAEGYPRRLGRDDDLALHGPGRSLVPIVATTAVRVTCGLHRGWWNGVDPIRMPFDARPANLFRMVFARTA